MVPDETLTQYIQSCVQRVGVGHNNCKHYEHERGENVYKKMYSSLSINLTKCIIFKIKKVCIKNKQSTLHSFSGQSES